MTSKLTRERLSDILEFGSGRLIKPISDEEIELMARMALAAMDSEPVAVVRYVDAGFKRPGIHVSVYDTSLPDGTELFTTPQPAPVVPDDVLEALQKVARIRLDLNDFYGDRRGIADCLCDAEEALIEVVNRRAAILNGGKS